MSQQIIRISYFKNHVVILSQGENIARIPILIEFPVYMYA